MLEGMEKTHAVYVIDASHPRSPRERCEHFSGNSDSGESTLGVGICAVRKGSVGVWSRSLSLLPPEGDMQMRMADARLLLKGGMGARIDGLGGSHEHRLGPDHDRALSGF